MQEIIALVQLIHHSKFRSNGLLNIILDPNSQMRQLYDALANGQVSTDDDLRVMLPELAQNPAKLYTLKSRLKDRLLDSVLFLDLDESAFKDRQGAFGQCVRKWSAAIILFSKNTWQSAVPVLENLLRHTIRFEFTEITINILRTLRLYYGTMVGDQNQYETVDQQLKKMEAVWAAECSAENLYTELIIRYVRSKAGKEAIAAKALEYFKAIQPNLELYSSYKLHFFGRLIEIMIYDSRHDYKGMAAVCEKAISFFENKDYRSDSALQGLYYNLLLCELNLRNYGRCRELADKHRAMYDEGTFNWFKLQELYFLVAMHSENYVDASIICNTTISHPQLSELPEHVVEMWKIFEAYIAFLQCIGLLPEEGSSGRFKVARFVNETQVFSKDKRGMNIPILIIQFIFPLAEGRFEELADRVENMTKYRSRYLDESAVRSNCFFRMLEQMPKAMFQMADVERRAEKYKLKLEGIPLEAANQNHEIEIIPYETLWEILLGILPNRRGFGTKGSAPPPKSLLLAPRLAVGRI